MFCDFRVGLLLGVDVQRIVKLSELLEEIYLVGDFRQGVHPALNQRAQLFVIVFARNLALVEIGRRRREKLVGSQLLYIKTVEPL